MDYHLQNLLTGEIVRLAPDSNLIGSANHATVPTATNGPPLAALIVRYPSETWTVFGLSNDPVISFDDQELQPGQRAALRKDAILSIGEEQFRVLSPQDEDGSKAAAFDAIHSRPVCFVYVTYPDGKEECRAVDHDLLIGRSDFCHIQFADPKLSRLKALLAFDSGEWFIHNMTEKPIGRNRKAVSQFTRIADGDLLQIGPLVLRIEMRAVTDTPPPASVDGVNASVNADRSKEFAKAAATAVPTDFSDATDDGTGEQAALPDLQLLREHARQFEQWLKAHPPRASAKPKDGLGGWFETQRDRLKRFWLDTPETTSARSLRAAGRVDEAFTVLERAIRARPDSPELLRELYRLYEALGFHELCYRPLRQIEKLAEIRGTPDAWVLETLARLCEKLGAASPTMTNRAIDYWSKVEEATGTNREHEKNGVLARRTIRDGGYTG